MDFFELAERRRSLRKFAPRDVENEVIDNIMRATLTAPSSRNSRSSRFMVVKDKQLLQGIAEMRDYGSAFVAEAPLAIIVAGDKSLTDLWVDNASISATFLQLAAEAAGLGSCWVHINGRPHRKDDPSQGTAEEHLRKIMDIPAEWGLLCAVAIGYSPYDEVRPHPETDDTDKVIYLG